MQINRSQSELAAARINDEMTSLFVQCLHRQTPSHGRRLRLKCLLMFISLNILIEMNLWLLFMHVASAATCMFEFTFRKINSHFIRLIGMCRCGKTAQLIHWRYRTQAYERNHEIFFVFTNMTDEERPKRHTAQSRRGRGTNKNKKWDHNNNK